jgi:hypothetical protein
MTASQKLNFNKLTLAAFVAITVNTLLLKLAPLLGITAESGGLLKLVFKIIPGIAGISFLHSAFFWVIFHYLTGFGMALFYFFVFAKFRISKWTKGVLFSFIPWLINGVIVLPMLGRGVIGIHQLPVSGIIYFFFANLVFAIILAVISEI